jgi:hypothetical protein
VIDDRGTIRGGTAPDMSFAAFDAFDTFQCGSGTVRANLLSDCLDMGNPLSILARFIFLPVPALPQGQRFSIRASSRSRTNLLVSD